MIYLTKQELFSIIKLIAAVKITSGFVKLCKAGGSESASQQHADC